MYPTKSHAWYADRYISNFGFQLLPLKPQSKLPAVNNWGNNPHQPQYWADNPEQGIGLALGASGMCSLDIDCMESFRIILDEFGIPHDSLDAYPTIQGASKGYRVLFKAPDGVGYAKLNWPRKDGQGKHYTVFELRASSDGHQRFDVLPPSIHPDTKQPYKWLVQPPQTRDQWLEPPHWLVSVWEAWDKFKPQMQQACPWAEQPAPRQIVQQPRRVEQGASVIDQYIAANPLDQQLERYGYKRKGRGRYLSPHSGTGLPGVILFPGGESCWIHHASDPLCSESTGHPVNAFDLFCYYDHNAEASKAVKAAAEAMGIKPATRQAADPLTVAPAPAKQEPVLPDPSTQDATEPDEPDVFMPFRPLGYQGDYYFYLPRNTEQVIKLKRGSHTSAAEMMGMAPLEWWEANYPREKGGCDWQLAANACMRACERAGVYSIENERGRGAWYDAGRAVLHMGGKLVIDGEPVAISDFKSRFIYTRQAAFDNGASGAPASDALSMDIRNAFCSLNWVNPLHGKLLAGWVMLAPACGAMSWRPHIWLTAQRGAGKTWVQTRMVEPILGSAALMVQGGTTEAGIRQKLKSDSRPIVFDESESEDIKAQSRMKTVLELARQSSSDTGAEIVKGTASGDGMSFRMRSMFMLGSINVSLQQAADETRFSVLELGKPDKTPKEFEAFEHHVDSLFTAENCAAIRARSYRLIPVIRNNARKIADALANLPGLSRRIGDQLGTLLAGYFALTASYEISDKAAEVLVSDIDLSDAKQQQAASDEYSCLNRMLQAQIRFDLPERGSTQRSMGELIDCAAGRNNISGMSSFDANEALKRHGMAVEGENLLIANNHSELERLLRNTPYAIGWNVILRRIDGAKSTDPKRFAGARSRALSIPLCVTQ